MKRWTKSERSLLLITLILLFALAIKSQFFDGYKPQDSFEEQLTERALDRIEIKRLTSAKVVKIKNLDPDQFENLEDDQVYLVVIRKYLLGIVPYGETRILE